MRSGDPSSAPSSTYSSGTAFGRLVAPAREEQLLDPLGRVGVAAPHHRVLVEVVIACAHAADVQRDARASSPRSSPATSSVRCTVVDAWIASVSSERPDRAAPFSSVARNSRRVGGGEAHRDPAVGDLGRERDVRGTARGEVDRQTPDSGAGSNAAACPGRSRRRPRRAARSRAPSCATGAFAPEDLAHDRDVVAGARDRLRPRLAVPAFDDLRAREAEAGDHAARSRRATRGSRTPSRSPRACGPRSARRRSRA